MASPLSSAVSSVINTVTNALSIFGSNGSDALYPGHDKDTNNIVSIIESSYWNQSLPYSFSVIDTSVGPSSTAAGYFEFTLPISPQNITQDEPYAFDWKPTQGGTIVNYSGNRYRDLTISGTTGNYPANTVGVNSNGTALFQSNFSTTNTISSSGYLTFLALRNYFRAYYQDKINPNNKTFQLVFNNYKDGESQIVELTKFSMKRQSGRPFLYDYTLQFKVIGVVSAKAQDSGGLLGTIDAVSNGIGDVVTASRAIIYQSQNLALQVISSVDATLNGPAVAASLIYKLVSGGFGSALSDLTFAAADFTKELLQTWTTPTVAAAFKGYIQQGQLAEMSGQGSSANALTAPTNSTQTNLNTPANGVPNSLPANYFTYSSMNLPSDALIQNNPASAINSIGSGLLSLPVTLFPQGAVDALSLYQQNLFTNPSQFYLDNIASIQSVMDKASDSYGLSSTQYNTTYDRTSVTAQQTSSAITYNQFQFLYSLQQLIKSYYTFLINPNLFQSTYNENFNTLNQQFNNQLTEAVANSVTQIIFPQGTTLERIAEQYLGDAELWTSIVTLNNLVPPYVITDMSDTTLNVIHPGQTLLIPNSASLPVNVLPQVPLVPQFADFTPAEQSLGIDIKLDSNYDLEITNNGDLQVIGGLDNLKQAINLKLLYSPGDVFQHPTIGSALTIGSKIPIISGIKMNILNSLQQDPRVTSVNNLTLTNINNAININFSITPINSGTPTPVTLIV